MSLILEALKKLEREQARGSSQITTAGEAPWSEGKRPIPVWALGLGAVGLVAIGAFGASLLASRPATAPANAADATNTQQAARPPAPVAVPAIAHTAPPETRVVPAHVAPAATAPPAVPPSHRVATPPTPRSTPYAPLAPARVAAAATPAPSVVRTPRPASPPAAEPRLQAISERDGKPIAMIDDKIFFEGDEIGGVKVLRIGAGEVEIEWKQARRLLRF